MNNKLKYKLGINGFKNNLYCIQQNQDMNVVIPCGIEIGDLMNDLASLFPSFFVQNEKIKYSFQT